MKYHRNGDSAFLLTTRERRVLDLVRAGKKYREIGEEFGVAGTSISATVGVAAEKERLLTLAAQDRRSPGAATTLRKAKGNGTLVDVRKGRWKIG